MTHSNLRPWMAPALFPVMMTNSFIAIFVGVSGAMLRFTNIVNRMKASYTPERKENYSVLPDITPVKPVGPTKLRLVAPPAKKAAERMARLRKDNSHKKLG